MKEEANKVCPGSNHKTMGSHCAGIPLEGSEFCSECRPVFARRGVSSVAMDRRGFLELLRS